MRMQMVFLDIGAAVDDRGLVEMGWIDASHGQIQGKWFQSKSPTAITRRLDRDPR
jgi:hypothetical protein